MKVVFKKPRDNKLLISIILIDWSVRQSVHILHYLNSQDGERNDYINSINIK